MKKTIAFLFVFVLLVSPCLASEPLTVTRVIDGNTLKLSNGEKVRLIGVDTPESSYNAKLRSDAKRTGRSAKEIIKIGKQATEFTRKLVLGKQVSLEYDVQPKDPYGRTLAYVSFYYLDPRLKYVEGEKEGQTIFLNATLIKAGYAQVLTVPPNVKHQDLFVKLEKEAREKGRGLWK